MQNVTSSVSQITMDMMFVVVTAFFVHDLFPDC